MMDPPKILLEATFLGAVTDPADDHHREALDLYLDLVRQYEDERVLLVAVSDHLRRFRGRQHLGPLAPADELHVGFQHRRAARRLAQRTGSDLQHALTLVMCDRHRVSRLATFDPHFHRYSLALLPECNAGAC